MNPSSPRGKVLVVDNEKEVHLMLAQILGQEGLEVYGVESGLQALQELAEREREYWGATPVLRGPSGSATSGNGWSTSSQGNQKSLA